MSEVVHILSLGAGVQSSCLALMASMGLVKPMPVAAIFADTQDEPKAVYEWLGWLTKHLLFPVLTVTKGSLSEAALRMRVTAEGRTITRTYIPTFTLNADGSQGKIVQRPCTRDFKLGPLMKKVREIAGIKRGQSTVGVVQWIGISLDEVYRMKPSGVKWAENRWPLVEAKMNRHDCLRWMERNKYPAPPRSACVYCPFHSDAEWVRLKTQAPEEFEKAALFEKELQRTKAESDNFRSIPFLHRSMKPLAEVDFSTDAERGQVNMFNNECLGLCGV